MRQCQEYPSKDCPISAISHRLQRRIAICIRWGSRAHGLSHSPRLSQRLGSQAHAVPLRPIFQLGLSQDRLPNLSGFSHSHSNCLSRLHDRIQFFNKPKLPCSSAGWCRCAAEPLPCIVVHRFRHDAILLHVLICVVSPSSRF